MVFLLWSAVRRSGGWRLLRFYHKRKHGPPASRADLGERCGVRALIVCGLVRTLAGMPGRSGRNGKKKFVFLLPDAVPIRGGVPYRSGTDPNRFFIFLSCVILRRWRADLLPVLRSVCVPDPARIRYARMYLLRARVLRFRAVSALLIISTACRAFSC